MNKSKQPVYDDRVKRTIMGLREGLTREELAQEFQLGSWKSLDIHMRRKGFDWDKYNQQYIPATDKVDKVREKSVNAVPVKAEQVVRLFEKQGAEADPMEIAIELGFSNHRQMSEYMERNGMVWNVELCNYVERIDLPASKPKRTYLGKGKEAKQKPEAQDQLPDYMSVYLPLLQLLEANKDRLNDLLLPVNEGQIPKYAVPGAPKTKSIYMSDLLARLVTEFSESKNLSQREVVEAAIVEYLKRYGYKYEMDRLLGKR